MIIKTYAGSLKQLRPDLLLIIALASMIAFITFQNSHQIPDVLSHYGDVWFETDTERIVNDMTDRSADHWRTTVHPIFPLLTYPPTKALMNVFQIQPLKAVRIVNAAISSVWISTLFVVLRLFGCRRFDSVIFSILGATSAAAIVWFAIPETFSLGSLSMMIALGIIALSQHVLVSSLWYAIISAFTLSVTVTNWMAGIMATFVKFDWRQTVQITINAFCIVIVLWSVQNYFFSRVSYFVALSPIEKRYILSEEIGGPLNVLKSFVFHTMIIPKIEVRQKVKLLDNTEISIMVTQSSTPGSGTIWGKIGVALWGMLLGLGLWNLFFSKENLHLRIVLGSILVGQLFLHLLYGPETFLYSLHFAPFLIILASLSTLTRARPYALVLAALLIIFSGINNNLQFISAAEMFQMLATS